MDDVHFREAKFNPCRLMMAVRVYHTLTHTHTKPLNDEYNATHVPCRRIIIILCVRRRNMNGEYFSLIFYPMEKQFFICICFFFPFVFAVASCVLILSIGVQSANGKNESFAFHHIIFRFFFPSFLTRRFRNFRIFLSPLVSAASNGQRVIDFNERVRCKFSLFFFVPLRSLWVSTNAVLLLR